MKKMIFAYTGTAGHLIWLIQRATKSVAHHFQNSQIEPLEYDQPNYYKNPELTEHDKTLMLLDDLTEQEIIDYIIDYNNGPDKNDNKT